MKRVRLQMLCCLILSISNSTFSADSKAKPEVALGLAPSGGSVSDLVMGRKHYKIEQLDHLQVAIIEGRPFKPVGGIIMTGMEELKAAANGGDSTAQFVLARFHLEGRQGMRKDHVEAYKWAALAALQGEESSTALLRELKLFMGPDETALARKAVVNHITQRLERL